MEEEQIAKDSAIKTPIHFPTDFFET